MYKLAVFTLMMLSLFGCRNDNSLKEAKGYLPSSWSSAEVISLCDQDSSSRTHPTLSALENDGKAYYNKKVKRSLHEMYVSFDFISDCCREFDIIHVIEDDVLKIRYSPKDVMPCDCKCDYQGIVNIADKQKDFTDVYRVSIKRGK